jgi:phospholipid/cholesterol/gamma-HCH transport system substrate-binding protein
MADIPPPASDAPPPLQPGMPVQQSEPAAKAPPVPHLQLKATLLLIFTLALVTGAALYLMYARGYFEAKQTLVLITDNSEGVAPGMDLTFSGFPIGTVRNVGLGADGNVRITIDVARKDAGWLRTSSVFTLVKGLVGGAQLRAYSGVLTDPPLPAGAERPVLRGDANAEIQRMIGAARDMLDNLTEMTAQGSELSRTLAHLQVFTQKLQSRQGALHAVFGNEEDARKLVVAIERANAAMARLDGMMAKADTQVFGANGLMTKADAQVFGPDGLMTDARATVRQFHGVLSDARGSLQRVDAVLNEAQGVGANLKAGTADLTSLRGDVEANLRKIEDMLNELNRRWPFAKEREVQLP